LNSSNIPATLTASYTHFNNNNNDSCSYSGHNDSKDSDANTTVNMVSRFKTINMQYNDNASNISNLEANDSVIFLTEKIYLNFQFQESGSQNSQSAYNLFYFEYLDRFDFPSFDKIYWCDKIRIKHYLTENYIAVREYERHPGVVTMELTTEKEFDFDSCTFRLINIIPEKDSKWSQTLNVKTGFLIKHVKTNLFLSFEMGSYNHPREKDIKGKLSLSKNPVENDILTIQTIENEKILEINFIKNAYTYIKYYVSINNELQSIYLI
jgi:hypothetical protein